MPKLTHLKLGTCDVMIPMLLDETLRDAAERAMESMAEYIMELDEADNIKCMEKAPRMTRWLNGLE